MNQTKIEVDDSLFGIAEISQSFLALERRRTKFLVGSIVFALMMNVGWLTIAVLRDRYRAKTIKDLSSAVADLSDQNTTLQDQVKLLTEAQAKLSDTVQNAIDQKIVLDQIADLLSEERRSLDCVALYVSGQPSKSNSCTDVNKRLKDLQAGKPGVFPQPLVRVPVVPPSTVTTPSPTTTTTRPAPPTTTTTPCKINLLGLCLGGS